MISEALYQHLPPEVAQLTMEYHGPDRKRVHLIRVASHWMLSQLMDGISRLWQSLLQRRSEIMLIVTCFSFLFAILALLAYSWICRIGFLAAIIMLEAALLGYAAWEGLSRLSESCRAMQEKLEVN